MEVRNRLENLIRQNEEDSSILFEFEIEKLEILIDILTSLMPELQLTHLHFLHRLFSRSRLD